MVTTNQKYILDIYTKNRKGNPNITLKIGMKSQEKIAKGEERGGKNYKNKSIHIDNDLKCKCTKCSNQKTE